MFWIDLGLLGITAYRMVSALKVTFAKFEILALIFLFALGLKSLILFVLIGVGLRPYPNIQIGTILIILIATIWWTKNETENYVSNSTLETDWQSVFSVILIGILFVVSLSNAWFFPITQSDAAWYQVKGVSFFYETRFDSEWIVPQLRQYPPFIPLLFSWFTAFGIEQLQMIFPFFFLSLVIIFYSRALELTGSSKMSAMLSLVLVTTPYIWWHGILPFLDLCTAVFFSAGTLYWFFWMDCMGVEKEKKRCRTMAFLSGLFFGLSAWTRMEFLLYCLIPLSMTFCAEEVLEKEGERDQKSFLLFFLPMLFFPTIWFFILTGFELPIQGRVKMVGIVGVLAWLMGLVLITGKWKLKLSILIKFGTLAGIAYITFICMDNSGVVPGWKRVSIALFRTIVVNAFYMFTAFLVLFIFLGRLNNIPSLGKLLGIFLVFYLLVHFAIFSYSSPKWLTFGEYVRATFVDPGNSVNLSDARGMLPLYPILLFFISNIPYVRRGFGNV